MGRFSHLIIGLLLSLAALVAPSIAADYTKPGSFAVGLLELSIPDVTGDYPLETLAWYPAAGPALNSTKVKPTIDAPPATTGPYPLVVLIPGLSGSASMLDHWGQHLASYGFIVFASGYDRGGGDTHLLYNRPANVIRVIGYADALTASGGKLAGIIDTSRVGVWGLSTGGTTALQAGGARIDFKELNKWCAANKAEEYGESCQFVGHEATIAKLYGVADPFLEPMPPIWDTRVAALVLAAPGGELQVFGTTGISAVKVPTLILVTSTDQVVKPDINSLWAYDGISSKDKALAVFDKGAHYMFLYSLEPQFNEALSLTTAFFLNILKGDPIGKKALQTGEVLFPGLTYRSTLR